MRKQDAWVLYQKARARRAKAEVVVIENRAACEAAENNYDAASREEMAAADAWRAAVDRDMAAIEPGAEA